MRMKLGYHFSVILLVILLSFEKFQNTGALIGSKTRVQRVQPDELPFIVALAYDDTPDRPEINQFCTGTLVSPSAVLTTADCALSLSPRPTVIYAGSNSLRLCTKHYWADRYFYGDWAATNNASMNSANDDIAIVKLQKRMEGIQPAVLNAAPNSAKSRTIMRVIGWGNVGPGKFTAMKPDELRAAWVKIWPSRECEKKLIVPPATALSDIEYNSERKICTRSRLETGYVILSAGDNGGPLIDHKKHIIGVNTNVLPKDVDPVNQFNLHCSIRFYRDFLFYAISKSNSLLGHSITASIEIKSDSIP